MSNALTFYGRFAFPAITRQPLLLLGFVAESRKRRQEELKIEVKPDRNRFVEADAGTVNF